MKHETALHRRMLLELGRGSARLFRQNVGVATFPDGARVVYGLTPGSSDLIGWNSVEITPDMVGKRVAVFCAIEVKTQTGRLSRAQENFLEAVKRAGGRAGVARSVEEAQQIITG
jgi:hypothetical protein